jgi:hypothetical protein
MKKKKVKWRRINTYTCKGCGNDRLSLRYGRAKDGLCTTCVRNLPPEGQESLFEK